MSMVAAFCFPVSFNVQKSWISLTKAGLLVLVRLDGQQDTLGVASALRRFLRRGNDLDVGSPRIIYQAIIDPLRRFMPFLTYLPHGMSV